MINKILKNARIRKNLSQDELGEKLSLARNTISSYERGNSQPDFETIVRILDICDYEIKILDLYKTSSISESGKLNVFEFKASAFGASILII